MHVNLSFYRKSVMICLLVSITALMGCASSAGTKTASETNSKPASAADSVKPAGTEKAAPKNEQKGKIRVGYRAELDIGDVTEYFGYDALKAKGYTTEIKHLNESSGVIASLINGEIEIGNMLARDAIIARKKGVPIKIILPSNMIPQFVMVAQPEIKTVNDLKGKNVAYHGPGSATEIFPKMLVEKAGMNLKDVKWSILPESPNRAAAMQAKRIDATALEYLDVVTLQESGKFNIIGSMYDAAPEALESVFVTTEKQIKDNPAMLQDFAADMLAGYQVFYTNKDKWVQKTAELKINLAPDKLTKLHEFFKQIHFYPDGDILTKDKWDKAVTYFEKTSDDPKLKMDMSYEEIVDPQFFKK
jgi:ABC-type nitrate/sulfonate/bicarbonate transport system substrate-binding protein